VPDRRGLSVSVPDRAAQPVHPTIAQSKHSQSVSPETWPKAAAHVVGQRSVRLGLVLHAECAAQYSVGAFVSRAGLCQACLFPSQAALGLGAHASPYSLDSRAARDTMLVQAGKPPSPTVRSAQPHPTNTLP